MVHDPVTFPMVASRATVIDTGLSFMTPSCSSTIFSLNLLRLFRKRDFSGKEAFMAVTPIFTESTHLVRQMEVRF